MDFGRDSSSKNTASESVPTAYLRDINEGYLFKYTENRMWSKMGLKSAQQMLSKFKQLKRYFYLSDNLLSYSDSPKSKSRKSHCCS